MTIKSKRARRTLKNRNKYALGGNVFGDFAEGAMSSGSPFGPLGIISGVAGVLGGDGKRAAQDRAKAQQQTAIARQNAFANYAPTGPQYNSMFKNGGEVKSKKRLKFGSDREALEYYQNIGAGKPILYDPSTEKVTGIKNKNKLEVRQSTEKDFLNQREYMSNRNIPNKPKGKFEDGGKIGRGTTFEQMLGQPLTEPDYRYGFPNLVKLSQEDANLSSSFQPKYHTKRDSAYFYPVLNKLEQFVGDKGIDNLTPEQLKHISTISNTTSRPSYFMKKYKGDALPEELPGGVGALNRIIESASNEELDKILGTDYTGLKGQGIGKKISTAKSLIPKGAKSWDVMRAASYLGTGGMEDDFGSLLELGEHEMNKAGLIETPEETEMANKNNKMAYGGNVNRYAMGGNVPVELEGGESGVMPNGQDFSVEGPSHAQGGVPMELPEGTDIFSDRIKMPGTKKTYSDLNKKISNKINKYKATLDNPESTGISKRTAEMMLNKLNGEQRNLFVDQERLKQTKAGLNAKFKFPDGGTVEDWMLDPTSFGISGDQMQSNNAQPSSFNQDLISGFGKNTVGVDPVADANNNLAGISSKLSGLMSKVSPLAGVLSQAAPALYNIGQGLFGKADTLDPQDTSNIQGLAELSRLKNRRFNIDPQLEVNRRSSAIARRNLSQGARSRGELLSGLSSTSGQRGLADMQAYSQQQNMNNQYASEAGQMASNIGAQEASNMARVQDYNSRSRAAQQGFLSKGLSQSSGLLQNRTRNNNLQESDRLRIEALKKMFPSQKFNV